MPGLFGLQIRSYQQFLHASQRLSVNLPMHARRERLTGILQRQTSRENSLCDLRQLQGANNAMHEKVCRC
jgi:hypothetical protein